MMQLAKNIERRQQRSLEEKRALLKHIDYVPDLRIRTLPYFRSRLIEMQELSLGYEGRPLFEPLTLSIESGERIALIGANGSGKSSLFKAILGELEPLSGRLLVGSQLKISLVNQESGFLSGDLKDFARQRGIDESLFKAILRKLDFLRIDFEKDMSSYSQGEKKKVLLAASLSDPSHLYLWDEPLNFIDYYSRQQIERLILTYRPTMIFVEHDQHFCEQVADRIVELKRLER